jgi:hypothetical protein
LKDGEKIGYRRTDRVNEFNRAYFKNMVFSGGSNILFQSGVKGLKE